MSGPLQPERPANVMVREEAEEQQSKNSLQRMGQMVHYRLKLCHSADMDVIIRAFNYDSSISNCLVAQSVWLGELKCLIINQLDVF